MTEQQLSDKMAQMIRVGFVNARQPEKMRVKVTIPDTTGAELVTDFLPVLCPRACEDMQYDLPDVGDQVLCLFLSYGLEQGFVIGAMYGKQVPPVQSGDKWHRLFKDGTYLEYDRESHTLTGDVKGTVNLKAEHSVTIEEGVRIAQLLESYGYDCLNVDTGTYDAFYYACPPMYMPKGYGVDLAAAAKQAVAIPILAGGRMNDPSIAEKAICEGKIDAVVLGRAALADPDYPNKVLANHLDEIRPCIACNQGCLTRLQQGKQPSCAVNPQAMRELRFAIRPAATKKKVVVVGGGPAGMEAARVAAIRPSGMVLRLATTFRGGQPARQTTKKGEYHARQTGGIRCRSQSC